MEMGGLKILLSFLEKTSRDVRIGPAHISLFTAIMKCWCDQGCQEIININRKDLMHNAKICSPTTYHRIIIQLNDFGYLRYLGTTNKWEKSIVKFDL